MSYQQEIEPGAEMGRGGITVKVQGWGSVKEDLWEGQAHNLGEIEKD